MAQEAVVEFQGKVVVEDAGSCGNVSVTLGGLEERFYWEFCGAGSGYLVSITVPPAEVWKSTYPLRKYKREEFLAGLAKEVIRLRAPGADYITTDDAILLKESIAP